MKTEINLENKAKFFAQYWGQNIVLYDSGTNPFAYFGILDHGILIDILEKDRLNYKLELKPLSSITDEDAIEVVSIVEGLGMRSSAMRNPKSWCINAIGKTLYLTSPVVDLPPLKRLRFTLDGVVC